MQKLKEKRKRSWKKCTDEVETVELDQVEPVEEEKTEVANVAEENGMEEDDDDKEWDAKSQDDVNLNVKGAFDGRRILSLNLS